MISYLAIYVLGLLALVAGAMQSISWELRLVTPLAVLPLLWGLFNAAPRLPRDPSRRSGPWSVA